MAYNESMSEQPFQSLSGQLLVAMPGMADPSFQGSVTLICQHDQNGAVGLTVNRPADFGFASVLNQLDLASDPEHTGRVPVLIGGPVQPERGFVLHHASEDGWESSHVIDGQWAITTSRDILVAMAGGNGPEEAALALGYAGWSAGQLEQELADNAWLTVAATSQILFRTDIAQRWHAATQLLGFESHQLSSHVGHA